ncbi:MAG: hypothetical protein HC838_12575, partial [Spirulinaceae cyanobacterium RM2_2_10]|nr:hypothetical protein [Spirulinaceae cyanobacterium RM2_2_10]
LSLGGNFWIGALPYIGPIGCQLPASGTLLAHGLWKMLPIHRCWGCDRSMTPPITASVLSVPLPFHSHTFEFSPVHLCLSPDNIGLTLHYSSP